MPPEINDPRDVFSKISPVYDIAVRTSEDSPDQPGYYGLPILKRPFWKWEIALYFFFEGVSAGSYILSTVADLSGADKNARLVRSGRYLAFMTIMACPPLLIADLGRPERFHHMLRIFKKTSPMNHGAWALTGYGTFSTLAMLMASPPYMLPIVGYVVRFMQRVLHDRFLAVCGLPFAAFMVIYPGVLLETTANPIWARTNFLGPLFACSSMSSGAAALTLANCRVDDYQMHDRLRKFEDVAAVGEAAALGLYLGTAQKATRPLLKGKQSRLFLFGAIGLGIVVPALLRRSKNATVRNVIAPVLTLAGSAALKWSITYAGQESAMDFEQASRNAEMKDGKPFWGPADRSAQFTPPQ